MSMNGSVDKLAEGFRAVIQDIVSPVNEEIKVVKGDIEALLDELSKMESRVTVQYRRDRQDSENRPGNRMVTVSTRTSKPNSSTAPRRR